MAALGLIAVQLVLCVALAYMLPSAWLPWGLAAAILATPVAATLPRGRTGSRLLFRRRVRADSDARITAVPNVDAGATGLLGVSVDGTVATTVVEMSCGADVLSLISRNGRESTSGPRVPTAALATSLLDPARTIGGIDVVIRGERTEDGPAGRSLDGLAGSLPMLARVRTLASIRFDLVELADRAEQHHGDSGAGGITGTDAAANAGRSIAVATERVRRQLVHLGRPARALSPSEVGPALAHADEVRAAAPSHQAAYDREELDALWERPAETVIEVVELRRAAAGPGRIEMTSTLLSEPLDHGEPLIAHRTAPRVGTAAELQRAGPRTCGWGQILGATDDDRMAVLPIAGLHLGTTLLLADVEVVRQVLWRAVGAGMRLALVTDRPGTWVSLARAVAAPARLVVADPARPLPMEIDAIVWDTAAGPAPTATDDYSTPGGLERPQPTLIRVLGAQTPGGAAGVEHALAGRPDLVLDARVSGWLAVERPGHRTLSLRIVHGPGEPAPHETEQPGALHP